MKSLLAAIAIITTPFVTAEQTTEPPLVSTTGTAEIKVVPDLADIQFQVEVRNADLAIARKQQTERAAKVLAALRAAGVAEADLQSADLSITPNYTEKRESFQTATVRFFTVSQTVAVTLHNVKTVPDVIAAGVAAGATEVSNVTLRTSDLRKHRDAARANAIKAAKEKAIALAGELGAKIGKPYRISEGGGSFTPVFNRMSNNGSIGGNAIDGALFGGEGTEAFAPGTISISASVGVSFWLE